MILPSLPNSSLPTSRLKGGTAKSSHKKRKVKKRFNIGIKKKGSSSTHSAPYYDGGVVSDELVQYIEGTDTSQEGEVFDGELNSEIGKEIDSNLYSDATPIFDNEDDVAPGTVKWNDLVPIPKLQDTLPAEEEDEFLGYNLSTLEIPDYLIGKNKVANDISSVPVINDDDATIKSSSQPTKKDFKDKIHLYGNPRAQMDNGAKCSVTNLLYLLR